jgi:hypothetical protein
MSQSRAFNVSKDDWNKCYDVGQKGGSSKPAKPVKRCSWANSGRGSETDLYYFSLIDKIGNRPVVLKRPKETQPFKMPARANQLNRDFACSQPNWAPACL